MRNKIVKKNLKIAQNVVKMAFFRRFGGSVTFTEASAELFRPEMTEASAEASVSVVHYNLSFLGHCLILLPKSKIPRFI